MKTLTLSHQELRASVRFTDPFMHTMEKEDEILQHCAAGSLRPPSLVACGQEYLIFNGNHRVLVAINNKLTITCTLLENLDDVHKSQINEGDRDRDLTMVSPLTFEAVVADLAKSADQYRDVSPDDYAYV